MKVIRPLTITDALLISSSVAEPAAGDPAAWNAATVYAIGDRVHRLTTHRVYKRLVAGTTGTAPESDATNWADDGSTLRWAMFDQEVNTQTSAASSLSVTLAPGVVVNSLALIELLGASATITVTDGAGGPVVYSKTVGLNGPTVADWYSYFFDPYSQRGTLIVTDLPLYAAARITVTITGTGTVKCGGCIVGTVYDLGDTQYGVSAGIRDYSRKETDPVTGVVSLEKRKFAKLLRAQFRLAAGAVSAVHKVLSDLRATPCVWIGEDSGNYDPLVVFGWYRDFALTVDFPTASIYSLEVEGMT